MLWSLEQKLDLGAPSPQHLVSARVPSGPLIPWPIPGDSGPPDGLTGVMGPHEERAVDRICHSEGHANMIYY
jgi:hypothetical protein